MKRKLIVTLVASALELIASTAGAQAVGSCDLTGTQTSTSVATGVVSGPMSPVTGFPEYVTSFGSATNPNILPFTVQRCTDVNLCFFDPVVPSDPLSIQIGTGGEAFYWDASTVVSNAAGDRIMTAVFAAETAFLQEGPNGELIDGSQFPFLRMRYVIGVPTDGTYTVLHPWGAQKFTVVGATGARDVFHTVDQGLTPGQPTTGPVGPFLYIPDFMAANPGFLGDANGLPDIVQGGPCRNEVVITGKDALGNDIDFGNGTGETILSSQLFTVQGMVYDGKVQTPLVPTRATFTRDGTSSQVDAFAQSTTTAALTVDNGDTVAASSLAGPVAMGREVVGAIGLDSASLQLGANSVLPPLVKLTATEASAATDQTAINVAVVDFVDVTQADYDPATGKLTIMATTGDQVAQPVLTVRDFGPMANGLLVSDTVAPPAIIHVDSAGGGRASARVRVVEALPPVAPSDVLPSAQTARSMTVSWSDNATNESGYRVTLTPVAGGPAVVVTTGANVSSTPVNGLTPSTAYTVLVEAVNALATVAAPTVEASTLALPVAPSAVSGATSATVTRGINVTFTDNSADETAFKILRSTTAGGTYTTVGTMTVAAPASTGSITYTDNVGLNTNATYFYKVVAVRGTDESDASAASTGVQTPLGSTAVGAPTFGAATTSSITVNWTARPVTNPVSTTGYIVFRAQVTNGVVGAYQPVTGANPLGLVTSFNDSTVTAGATYRYRINAIGWSSYDPGQNGTASANVTAGVVVNLAAPTNVSANTLARPTVVWTDNASGETGYRVSRTPITVNADGSTTAGVTTLSAFTAAANATSARDPAGQATGATIRYDVAAMNGATAGALGTVHTSIGAMPTAAIPTAARVNGVAQVNLGWAARTAATVGGYEIQRCRATGVGFTTCAAGEVFAKVPGTAVNTTGTVDGRGTVSFSDTTVARNTSYVYRMRVVGGAGTGLSGAFSGLRAVTTN